MNNRHKAEIRRELQALMDHVEHENDINEFATGVFKVIIRLLNAHGTPIKGAVVLGGCVTLQEAEGGFIASAKQATWEQYHAEPDWRLDVIVLNRNFDRMPGFCFNMAIRDLAPEP